MSWGQRGKGKDRRQTAGAVGRGRSRTAGADGRSRGRIVFAFFATLRESAFRSAFSHVSPWRRTFPLANARGTDKTSNPGADLLLP
jgi:hypothetical protein